jgi:hypothetical protein
MPKHEVVVSHTPAPWTYKQAERGFTITVGQHDVFTLGEGGGGANVIAEDRANARLIVSAPHLLDALKYAVQEIEAFYEAAKTGSIKATISVGQFGRLDALKRRIGIAERGGE